MTDTTDALRRELPLLPVDHQDANTANFWVVRATMAAPSDKALRDAIRIRAAVRIHAATYKHSPEAMVTLPASVLFPLADDEAMSRLYSGADKQGARNGCVAGFVLCYLNLLWRDDPKGASLNKAVHLASRHAEKFPAWGNGAKVATTPRQIIKIWTESKSVSHLWLAWNLLDSKVMEPGGMETLLSLAEGFRRWLETFIPPKAKEPLVAADELWRPAPGRVQPKSLGPDEATLPDELADWLKSYRAPTTKFFP